MFSRRARQESKEEPQKKRPELGDLYVFTRNIVP